MSRRKTEVPSLANALAKGFADLKADEVETPTVEEVPENIEVIEQEVEPAPKPEYGRPSQHIAEQSSFVVSAKKQIASDRDVEDTEKPEVHQVKILDRPSTTIGDDFDVAW